MAWHARLNLDYRAEPATGGTRLDFRHDGPRPFAGLPYPHAASAAID